jgi:type IV pilus assembly protein PilE
MRTADRRRRGFTLIELVVTMAIVAILAMIAIPSYNSFMMKGRRASAQSFLMDVAQREQQYLLDNRSYGSLAQLNLPTPSDVDQFYTVTVVPTAGPPPTFTVTATPKAGTAQADDVTLTINEQNSKTPAGYW